MTMALRNDPRLYSGGAVVAPQPSLNLYANILARQQAKAEAMDQYERSRINSVNDAGLRDQDRKTLDDKLGELRSFYNINKPKIQKGNSQEAFDYEKKFRDVRDLIAQSKDRAARHNAAMQFYNERLKQDQRLPDDFMQDLHNNDQPIGSKYFDLATGENQEYKPFDVTKWASEPKPFVQDKYIKEFGDIKRNEVSTRTEPIPGNKLRLNEITESKYDLPAKQVIAARAADKYDNSYSFSNQVKNEMQDPVRRKQLSDLFKQEYGTEPTMPSDYAVAYTMEMLQPKISKPRTIENTEEKMRLSDQLSRGRMAVRDFYTKQHIDYRAERDIKNMIATDTNFDQIFNTVKDNLPDNLVKKVFGSPVDEKGHKLPPPEIKLSPDGQTYNFNVYSTDGEIDPTYSKQIPAAVVKAQMKQDLSSAIKTKTTLPAKTLPSATRAEWKAAGWNDKQIDEQVKLGKIKVK